MAIEVKLIVDGKEHKVYDYFMGLFRHNHYTSRPTTNGEAYPFVFHLPVDNNTLFLEWAIDPLLMKRVKIEFTSRYGTGKTTTFQLLDTCCLFCKYNFSDRGSDNLYQIVHLSPATIMRDGQLILKRKWAITDPDILNATPTVREEKNEKVVDYFITDLEGNKQPKYKVGDEIYINIITQDMIGKYFDIDLSSKTMDFEYDGQVLINDRIENYQIKSDNIKLKLKVVEPQNQGR